MNPMNHKERESMWQGQCTHAADSLSPQIEESRAGQSMGMAVGGSALGVERRRRDWRVYNAGGFELRGVA